jgi:hypothetical protein
VARPPLLQPSQHCFIRAQPRRAGNCAILR